MGRGCLAGPVVAGAAILPSDVDRRSLGWLREVTDSKLVSPANREKLEPLLKEWLLHWSVGVASVEEIDSINIHRASHLAMERALAGLSSAPAHILVDGKFLPKGCEEGLWTAIIKGDQKCLSIACASIIAKVHRDRMMVEYENTYPGYGFGVHKGYGTPFHKEKLKALGVTPIHRRSFAPVAQSLQLSASW